MLDEIDNIDNVIETLNGDVNATIVITDGRLPRLLCDYIRGQFIYITEDMLLSDQDERTQESLHIKIGSNLERKTLIDTLTRFGYLRVPNPNQVGEFGVKGDTVDFWTEGSSSALTRVTLLGSQVEAIKTVAARSFSGLKNLVEYTLLPYIPPRPSVSAEKVRELIKQNHDKRVKLVFENPDEICQTIQDAALQDKLDFSGFTCIGFQMTDRPHYLFDVTKTLLIKTHFELPAVGDLVVHAHHGLGRYMGTKKMRLLKDAPEKNYLIIQYARNALVYLPFDKTELLSNYYGNYRRLSSLGR